MANNIPAQGFCIHIQRIRQEQRPGIGFARTVGNYQCYWNNSPLDGLAGQVVERGGPGDNTGRGKQRHLCVHTGTYPLVVEEGNHYATYGYDQNHLLPALLLDNTGARVGILIHPCHDQEHQYLSSIGCINPTIGLKDAASLVDLADSRQRVIAIIDAMKAKLAGDFPRHGAIHNAVVVIEGDPS